MPRQRKPQSRPTSRILAHTGRDALSMALANLANAERCLAMLMQPDCASLVPHPAIVASAEVKNAYRHLAMLTYLEKSHTK